MGYSKSVGEGLYKPADFLKNIVILYNEKCELYS